MTPEAQRIAIAEACGWKLRRWQDRKGYECTGWDAPDGRKLVMGPPNYLGDLNAMHEAEKVLTHNQAIAYERALQPRAVFATAAQRAENFLRTIGKWDDAK